MMPPHEPAAPAPLTPPGRRARLVVYDGTNLEDVLEALGFSAGRLRSIEVGDGILVDYRDLGPVLIRRSELAKIRPAPPREDPGIVRIRDYRRTTTTREEEPYL